jgi:hypothetical protein
MLGFLFCAQLAAAAPRPDSVYSSVALREMVAAAAEANRRPPPELQAYSSHIETELALILRDTLGREHAAEVEQLASEAHWTRAERYELHIVGYRAQNVGVPYSTLSIVRGWTVPTLFGERLSFGAYIAGPNRRDTLTAVHPFATDREAFYRYSGGDTVAVLRIGDRRIPIARIRVRPEFRSRTPLGAFEGEIDIDAVRHQIVRMRGQLEILGARARSGSRLLRLTGIVSAAYVEFVNSEIAGKYWLPTRQRTEFQASVPLLGQTRSAFRIISTISDIAVVTDSTIAGPDTSHPLRVLVTWAPSDSVSRFDDWREELGTQSGAVHSDDFQDMAPPAWRSTGPPRVSMFPNSLRRIFRFNRIEGLYLGLAPEVDFRSARPGLSVGLFGGWAFSEKSARGGAFASYTHASVTTGVRAERALVSSNDFTQPVDEDPGFSALLTSVDDYDYVDRRSAVASISRALGSPNAGRVTVQVGLGDDRAATAHIEHGLFSTGKRFRPNRGMLEGRYTLGTLDLELHPNVTGDFVSPGVGARAHYEVGRGDLRWDRLELGLAARHYWGPLSVAAHADAGVVLGNTLPPQQLFELGGAVLLPGYDYKAFAGDQAALFRAFASYRFPVWKRPVRVWQHFFIPGLSPGIATSVQGGWTRASTRSAVEAIRELGVDQNGTPVSVPTGSIRSTFGIGLSFFADLVHVGVARPLDHPAPWRVVAGFGVQF